MVELKPAFSRGRTFLWFSVSVASFCCRVDLMGVTSIVRTLGLKASCYPRLLDNFHSTGISLDRLTELWVQTVIKFCPGILRINNRPVLVADGIKKQKSGKKMPAVKLLHQDSESNTKAEYIMGHSCQAIGILANACNSVFCIPFVSRIHEGIIESNRDKRTLMDKLINMFNALALKTPCYLVADAYYGNQKIIEGLLRSGHHLVCRARNTAVAYDLPVRTDKRGPGRPMKYGIRTKLMDLWNTDGAMIKTMASPVYGEDGIMLEVISKDLMVKYAKKSLRFVLVNHPTRGKVILFSSDTTLDPLEIIRIYGLRFKIEVSFKQAVWTLGTYAYRFWMKNMTPTKRNQGDVHLHMKSKKYRDDIKRKIHAYHTYIQVGLIAQGVLMLISTKATTAVWSNFGSWIRTVRAGVAPSEWVTAVSMRNALPEFLASDENACTFIKFTRKRLDLERAEGFQLQAS